MPYIPFEQCASQSWFKAVKVVCLLSRRLSTASMYWHVTVSQCACKPACELYWLQPYSCMRPKRWRQHTVLVVSGVF